MGTFQNPIGPHDPFNKKLRVERIEEDKLTPNQRQKEPDIEISQESFATASFLLQLLDRSFKAFIKTYTPRAPSSQTVKDNLILLKKSFHTLQQEDRSQDAAFLNELSKIWHQVLEDALHTPLAEQLVQQIQHFPEEQSHSFGYYLAEYAGQKWIPFPYMELIAKIHKEHLNNPSISSLTQWISQIERLLQTL